MRRLVCLSLLLFGVLAPAASADGEQYALVNNCYELQGAGGAVGKDGSGYRTGAGPAEAFRMQATALGKYLLFGRSSDFLAAGSGNAVVVAAKAGPQADWRVDPSGDGFRIVRPDSDKVLSVGDGGRLTLADAGQAGDRGRFSFRRAEGCAVFPEITTNASGTPSRGVVPFAETRGLVDAHMHMMAFEFIGGSVHCGRPWHPYGVEQALVDCPDHVTGAAPLETALGGKERHDPVGYPTFKDWPDNQSLTHETSYYKWLERAWMGGLRVYVNLFVDNEVLCEIYPLKRNSCDEMETIRLQNRRIHELEDYIDAQNGGPGKGWFRIVKDPFEARRVINDGKLAVVLGIETSKLFGCGVVNDRPTCTRAQIDRQLDEVHAMGVRDMEIVNKFDNGLAGVAGDAGQTGVVTNTGNKYDTNQYINFETCTGPPEAQDKPQVTPAGGDGRDELVGGFRAFLPPGQVPLYGPAPHCNIEGLTDLGEHLVNRMIEKGMIVDPDHLSVAARNEVLALVEKAQYSGIISSHTWSSPDALPRIYGVGGFVTPYAGDSTKFVEEWKKTKPAADPRFYFGFGYGADMNGFGSQGDPRGKDVPNPVTYPFKSFDGAVTFDKQRSGSREYDLNVDGVDHYGLYPDWIEDLRKLAGDEIIQDMARGPESYLQMWERAVGVPRTRCQPERGRATATGFRAAGNGEVRLRVGDTWEQMLRRAGQPNSRPAQGWTYCLQGPRDGRPAGELRPVLSREGRVVLVASTGAEHEARGVGRGDQVTRRLRRGARKVGRTLLVRKAGRDARFVYGVRGGRVTFVAVADRSVAGAAELRRHLRIAGL